MFNDPAPYARRLAARLYALPHRMAEALRLSKRRRPRKSGELEDLVGREGFTALTQAAEAARFNSS